MNLGKEPVHQYDVRPLFTRIQKDVRSMVIIIIITAAIQKKYKYDTGYLIKIIPM